MFFSCFTVDRMVLFLVIIVDALFHSTWMGEFSNDFFPHVLSFLLASARISGWNVFTCLCLHSLKRFQQEILLHKIHSLSYVDAAAFYLFDDSVFIITCVRFVDTSIVCKYSLLSFLLSISSINFTTGIFWTHNSKYHSNVSKVFSCCCFPSFSRNLSVQCAPNMYVIVIFHNL